MKEEKKKRKIDKKMMIITALIFVLILIILFLLFGRKASYTITFDTDGGTKITSIEVKDNEIVKLPEAPKKEGYKFVGWSNEEGKIITKGTKITEDLTLKAEWISNDAQTVTAKFDTDGGNKIDNLLIEKNKIVLLPVDPIKEGYVFVAWVDETGNFITENTVVKDNITLKAIWIKESAETVTVKFDTDNGGSIVIEKGKTIIFPIEPTKENYVFAGWVDEKGNPVTKDTIIDKDIKVKATWKDPYTCPLECTPVGDGSKCTKTTIKDVVVNTGCPSGTETVETFCSSHKRQVSVGFDEDQTFVDAGILCDGNPSGFCVDYNSRYTNSVDSCPAGYFKYTYSASGLDAEYGCAKKYNKGGSSCPSGYTREGNKCKRTETIACTAN